MSRNGLVRYRPMARRAVVTVPLATLWASPERERAETQVLLGDALLVDETRDGWLRVVAVGQPSGTRDPRGYPGWLPAARAASPEPPADGPRVMVDAVETVLDGRVPLDGVAFGTGLISLGEPGGGVCDVAVPGLPGRYRVPERDIVKAPRGTPDGASVLAMARRFLGVPFLWGGLSPRGFDCSGLVHAAYRRCGLTVPRDAHAQFEAATRVPPGEEQPGDLLFFAPPEEPVQHVGFFAGDGLMLDACPRTGEVVLHQIDGDRRATAVGAGRFHRRVPGALSPAGGMTFGRK
ncbi:C40 family peptidase [Actinomadura fibrosa]|uniref:NlpC/P60 family protein n=1 Tax=Actinomadura fibrosa TaxID=111802 RepID=A0ABW2XLD0_9ACTN|nr:C40 family peptidase [Actinomadura fibrosa]